MKDEYGREIINRIITEETDPGAIILCVRYTDETVGKGKCDEYSSGNCKRCPIHDYKTRIGMANNSVVVSIEYQYELEDDYIPKHCNLYEMITEYIKRCARKHHKET